MKLFSRFLDVALSLMCLNPAAYASEPPLVQLAILLDTSNSMDGLIDQAKSQLRKIANAFAYAKGNGLETVS